MSDSKPEESFDESYLLLKTKNGWRVLHPDHGMCILVSHDGVAEIDFSKAVTFNSNGKREIIAHADSLEEAKEILKENGCRKSEIRKAELLEEIVAYVK